MDGKLFGRCRSTAQQNGPYPSWYSQCNNRYSKVWNDYGIHVQRRQLWAMRVVYSKQSASHRELGKVFPDYHRSWRYSWSYSNRKDERKKNSKYDYHSTAVLDRTTTETYESIGTIYVRFIAVVDQLSKQTVKQVHADDVSKFLCREQGSWKMSITHTKTLTYRPSWQVLVEVMEQNLSEHIVHFWR